MTGPLTGRLAVVTGGSRGLGYAMAEALATAGADIVLVDVLPQVEESAERLAAATGRRVSAQRYDVSDPASVKGAFAALARSGRTASVLVNAAGIASNTPALDIEATEWNRVLAVNITGTFLVAQAFARAAVSAALPAAVVNIASMSGLVVNVPQTQAVYNTSKAAVSMLTKSLAVEWLALGVRVNAIAPGYFASDMTQRVVDEEPEKADVWVSRTPASRLGQPEELGPLAVYLCSDDSAFVVGQTIVIDGGYTIV